MKIKPGVRITGFKPELVFGLQVADGVFRDAGYECVLTSGTEGRHSETSLHYAGCAADLRSRHVPAERRPKILAELRKRLERDFDVILERTHFHLEWQPRR